MKRYYVTMTATYEYEDGHTESRSITKRYWTRWGKDRSFAAALKAVEKVMA